MPDRPPLRTLQQQAELHRNRAEAAYELGDAAHGKERQRHYAEAAALMERARVLQGEIEARMPWMREVG